MIVCHFTEAFTPDLSLTPLTYFSRLYVDIFWFLLLMSNKDITLLYPIECPMPRKLESGFSTLGGHWDPRATFCQQTWTLPVDLKIAKMDSKEPLAQTRCYHVLLIRLARTFQTEGDFVVYAKITISVTDKTAWNKVSTIIFLFKCVMHTTLEVVIRVRV